MTNNKSMLSNIVGSFFAAILGTSSITSAADNPVTTQPSGKSFMLTEAHQHSEGKGSGGNHDEGNCCGGMMQHGHSYAHLIASHADTLKLSDAQLGRIVRLQLKHTQEHQQSKQKPHESMMEFHQASMKPGTDDAALRKLAKDHAEAFNAMIEQHIKDRNAVNAILSADQRNQLKTLKMNHGMHGSGHGAQGGSHGQH